RRASHRLSQPTGLAPVVRKAVRRPTKKNQRARPRRALKDRILAAVRGTGMRTWTVEALMQAAGCSNYERVLRCAHELFLDNLLCCGPTEPPSGWSREYLQGLYEDQEWYKERLTRPASLSPATRRAMARATLGIVTVDAPAAAQTELTEEQIQTLIGDVAGLSDLVKRLRQWIVRKYRDDWTRVSPSDAREAANNDEEYRKEFGVLHHISTF